MQNPPASFGDELSLSIPCGSEEFADFILGLVGRTARRGRKFILQYSLSFDDIVHFYHLIEQRISGQNSATIVRFNFRAQYGDGSHVEISSLKDLRSYTELRNAQTASITLFFVILAKFPQDSRMFQRQTISLQFTRPVDYGERTNKEHYEYFASKIGVQNLVNIEVEYSEFTWGNDIINLLSNEIHKLEIRQIGIVNFALRYHFRLSAFLSLVISGAVFVLLYSTLSAATQSWEAQILADLQGLLNANVPLRQFIIDALVFFENSAIIRSKDEEKLGYILMTAAVTLPVTFIFINKSIGTMQRRSRILFTRKDIEEAKMADKSGNLSIFSFVISNFIAILLTFLSIYFS